MEKKKLPYEETSLEIVKILQADVILTSGGGDTGSTGSPGGPFDPDGDMDDAWT